MSLVSGEDDHESARFCEKQRAEGFELQNPFASTAAFALVFEIPVFLLRPNFNIQR